MIIPATILPAFGIVFVVLFTHDPDQRLVSSADAVRAVEAHEHFGQVRITLLTPHTERHIKRVIRE